jgi:hypothetical protein
MTPFTAVISTAIALLFVASLLLWNGPPIAALARAFPRSRRAAWVTMGIASAWTLYHVAHLGEADFGNYRALLFVAFAVLAALSFYQVPDFLAVRGAAALILLVAGVLLSATFMNYGAAALLLNALVYAGIILALYLAVSPFRLRDFVGWLFGRARRARIFGGLIGLYGLVLLSTALGAS